MSNTDIDTSTQTLNDHQTAYIDGLKEVIAFFEAHPEFVPDSGYTTETFDLFTHQTNSFSDSKDFIKSFAQLPGKVNKEGSDFFFTLNRSFGPHQIRAHAYRNEVCEKVKVGEETVTKTVPDPELVEKIPTVTVTETVEKFEWVCTPVLGLSSTLDA